jgi:hypothetical protein
MVLQQIKYKGILDKSKKCLFNELKIDLKIDPFEKFGLQIGEPKCGRG